MSLVYGHVTNRGEDSGYFDWMSYNRRCRLFPVGVSKLVLKISVTSTCNREVAGSNPVRSTSRACSSEVERITEVACRPVSIYHSGLTEGVFLGGC